jgi:hypothetical protein
MNLLKWDQRCLSNFVVNPAFFFLNTLCRGDVCVPSALTLGKAFFDEPPVKMATFDTETLVFDDEDDKRVIVIFDEK